MSHPSASPPQFIARQMAIGFGSVSVVAVVMCAVLLTIVYNVSGLIAGMRQAEEPIRQGQELAASVRELSIHIARSLADDNPRHLNDYETWRQRVKASSDTLKARIPAKEAWRMKKLTTLVSQIDEQLKQQALPAAQRGDKQQVQKSAAELQTLGAQASAQADVLALLGATQMEHSHVEATHSTRLGLLTGGVGVVLILALSLGFTLRLRAAVVMPLTSLTEAAQRFGRGEFDFRVGRVGRGELAALGGAMDHMADELKRREETLRRTERMAALGQLAAGVAHEMNNPIGIIRGYLKTMSPDEDRETLAEELAILDEEAGHCQRIARDLLSYARSEELEARPIAIKPFLTQLAERFGDSNEGRGRSVNVTLQDAQVEVDQTRLKQLVFNLLNNACQASPATETVWLKGHKQDQHYVLSVEDRGPGIAEEDQERIFEPFFSTRSDGSGLGLSVCLGIVRAHHGSIQIRNLDQGASVEVTLPLSQHHTPDRGSS